MGSTDMSESVLSESEVESDVVRFTFNKKKEQQQQRSNRGNDNPRETRSANNVKADRNNKVVDNRKIREAADQGNKSSRTSKWIKDSSDESDEEVNVVVDNRSRGSKYVSTDHRPDPNEMDRKRKDVGIRHQQVDKTIKKPRMETSTRCSPSPAGRPDNRNNKVPETMPMSAPAVAASRRTGTDFEGGISEVNQGQGVDINRKPIQLQKGTQLSQSEESQKELDRVRMKIFRQTYRIEANKLDAQKKELELKKVEIDGKKDIQKLNMLKAMEQYWLTRL